MVLTVHEFTPRAANEQTRPLLEARYRAILNGTHDIVFALDLEERCVFVNVRGEQVTGYGATDWLGRSFEPMLHPDDVATAYDAFLRSVAGEQCRCRLRIFDACGRTREMLVHTGPWVEAGETKGMLGLATEVSQPGAPCHEKERLAITLQSLADAVISTDADGRVLLMNELAEALTGWSQSEAAGQPLAKVVRALDAATHQPRPDSITRLLQQQRAPQAGQSLLVLSRDGSERRVEALGAPVRSRNGEALGAVLVLRETAQKRRLSLQKHRGQQPDSLDISLLASIIGSISLVSRRAQPTDTLHDVLAMVEQAIFKARALTQQLMMCSRCGQPVKKPADMGTLLAEASRRLLGRSAARVELQLDTDLWLVDMDAGQMGQVIESLLLHAMPHNGTVRLAAHNLLVSEPHELPLQPGRYVHVSVQDEGEGIPADLLDRLFDAHFSAKRQGTGMQLATSHSIVRHHGGVIQASSSPSGGALFEIFLPASEQASVAPADVANRVLHTVLTGASAPELAPPLEVETAVAS